MHIYSVDLANLRRRTWPSLQRGTKEQVQEHVRKLVIIQPQQIKCQQVCTAAMRLATKKETQATQYFSHHTRRLTSTGMLTHTHTHTHAGISLQSQPETRTRRRAIPGTSSHYTYPAEQHDPCQSRQHHFPKAAHEHKVVRSSSYVELPRKLCGAALTQICIVSSRARRNRNVCERVGEGSRADESAGRIGVDEKWSIG